MKKLVFPSPNLSHNGLCLSLQSFYFCKSNFLCLSSRFFMYALWSFIKYPNPIFICCISRSHSISLSSLSSFMFFCPLSIEKVHFRYFQILMELCVGIFYQVSIIRYTYLFYFFYNLLFLNTFRYNFKGPMGLSWKTAISNMTGLWLESPLEETHCLILVSLLKKCFKNKEAIKYIRYTSFSIFLISLGLGQFS